jgi:hypothetical protein
LKFWEGADKKMAPTLHVRLSEESVGFATGVMFGSVDRWRELIDDARSGGALADALSELSQGRALDIAGQELKHSP